MVQRLDLSTVTDEPFLAKSGENSKVAEAIHEDLAASQRQMAAELRAETQLWLTEHRHAIGSLDEQLWLTDQRLTGRIDELLAVAGRKLRAVHAVNTGVEASSRALELPTQVTDREPMGSSTQRPEMRMEPRLSPSDVDYYTR